MTDLMEARGLFQHSLSAAVWERVLNPEHAMLHDDRCPVSRYDERFDADTRVTHAVQQACGVPT